MNQAKILTADWSDPDVQMVYQMLCDTEDLPPDWPDAHWEGWLARRIVAELRNRNQKNDPPEKT